MQAQFELIAQQGAEALAVADSFDQRSATRTRSEERLTESSPEFVPPALSCEETRRAGSQQHPRAGWREHG